MTRDVTGLPGEGYQGRHYCAIDGRLLEQDEVVDGRCGCHGERVLSGGGFNFNPDPKTNQDPTHRPEGAGAETEAAGKEDKED